MCVYGETRSTLASTIERRVCVCVRDGWMGPHMVYFKELFTTGIIILLLHYSVGGGGTRLFLTRYRRGALFATYRFRKVSNCCCS